MNITTNSTSIFVIYHNWHFANIFPPHHNLYSCLHLLFSSKRVWRLQKWYDPPILRYIKYSEHTSYRRDGELSTRCSSSCTSWDRLRNPPHQTWYRYAYKIKYPHSQPYSYGSSKINYTVTMENSYTWGLCILLVEFIWFYFFFITFIFITFVITNVG